jgi:hypothetical protein
VSIDLAAVIEHERRVIAALRERRRAARPDDVWLKDERNLFGIALSGGGVRAATIGYGFLQALNQLGVLRLADYLSSVSGGGYLGGYVHARLWDARDSADPFGALFTAPDRERLLAYGRYLVPGSGAGSLWNLLRLIGALLASLVMNWVWVAALLALVVAGPTWLLDLALGGQGLHDVARWLAIGTGVVLAYHFFLHPLARLKLWSSDVLNRFEGALFGIALVLAPVAVFAAFGRGLSLAGPIAALAAVVLLVAGFFANPNVLTMHRFYRDRVAEAYLGTAGPRAARRRLADLALAPPRDAPYPLVNACLNLLGDVDPATYAGTKLSDYFLFSPDHCGAERVGYARTGELYRDMTLATAMACSGAAVNPAMGTLSGQPLAALMTLLDIRTGYWAPNPGFTGPRWLVTLPWWPYYHLLDLLNRTHSRRALVSVSDGGHVENLAVYELLRRRCRLIVALDAGADPSYEFTDLRNLVIRARQELHLVIRFRQDPERLVRPEPSVGFSRSHFVVADVLELGNEARGWRGLLVYVKASLRAPQSPKTVDSESFRYKTQHPAFPHESTADQFFDGAQWRAYYYLGRFMAGDLLREDVTDPARIARRDLSGLFAALNGLTGEAELNGYTLSGAPVAPAPS